jgi:molybdopterin converting factor small subunit
MPVTVYLPSTLRPHASGAEALTILEPVHTIAELLVALERRVPRLAAQLEEAVFNVVVNDEALAGGALQHPVRDGDRVEIVPARAGTEI